MIRVPPKEIAKMLALQERAIRDMLGGERIRRSGRRLFIGSLVQQLSGGWGAPQGQHDPEIRLPTDIREQNLRLIDELHRSTRAGNARLGVADLFTYLNSAFEAESVLLQEFCSRRGIGHIPASDALLASIDAGISPRWRYDAHFNEVGNEILAESIYRWITSMEAGAQISRRTNGKADRTIRLSTAKAPNAIQ